LARPSIIDNHPSRAEIEAAMVSGVGYGTVSKLYPEITKAAFYRHRKKMGGGQKYLAPPTITRSGDDLIAELNRIKQETHEIFEIAKSTKDYRIALSALDKQVRQIEVFADMMLRVEELRRASGDVEPIKIVYEVVHEPSYTH